MLFYKHDQSALGALGLTWIQDLSRQLGLQFVRPVGFQLVNIQIREGARQSTIIEGVFTVRGKLSHVRFRNSTHFPVVAEKQGKSQMTCLSALNSFLFSPHPAFSFFFLRQGMEEQKLRSRRGLELSMGHSGCSPYLFCHSCYPMCATNQMPLEPSVIKRFSGRHYNTCSNHQNKIRK